MKSEELKLLKEKWFSELKSWKKVDERKAKLFEVLDTTKEKLKVQGKSPQEIKVSLQQIFMNQFESDTQRRWQRK